MMMMMMMMLMMISRISVILFVTVAGNSALDNQTATSVRPELETSKLVKCEVGKFGVLCDEDCHCRQGLPCDADGRCPQDGACEPNYAGSTCSDCSEGLYGVNCSESCHCLSRILGACDSITGECDGGCAAGYNGSSCQEITGFVRLELMEMPIVNSGNTVKFTCRVVAPSEQPSIVMTSSSGITLLNASDVVKDNSSNDQYVSNFIFGPVLTAATHEFLCQVNTTSMTAITDAFNVTVVDPPVLTVTPFVSPAQSLTSSSVGLAWNSWHHGIDFGGSDGDEVEYLVEYRPTGESDWSNSSDWHLSNGTVVDRLIPDTVYDFAVRCRRPGPGGEGQRGPILQLVTKCGLPNSRGIPQNLTVVDTSHDTLNLTWQPPAHGDLKCELSKYVLHYSFVEHGHIRQVRLDVAGRLTSLALLNLTADTRYEISLAAVTDGPSPLTDAVVIATTRPLDSDSTSRKLTSVTNVTYVLHTDPTSVLLSWLPAVGRVREYILTAELVAAGNCLSIPGDIAITFHTVKTPNNKAMLSNLRPFSKYDVKIQIVSDFGLSEPTNITVEMPRSSPSARPSNLRISDSGPTFLFIQWDPIPCHEMNDDAIVYHCSLNLLLARRKRSDVTSDLPKSVNTTKNFVNVTNLQPQSLYEITVRGAGISATVYGPDAVMLYSTPANFTLSSPTLGMSVVNSTAMLYFIVPSADATNIDLNETAYELRITFHNKSLMGLSETTKYIVLTGNVSEYVDYDVRVADHIVEACVRLQDSRLGRSPWSDKVTMDPVNRSNMSRNDSFIPVVLNAPVIFTVKHLNLSTVAIHWRSLHDIRILKYKVQCVVVGDAANAASNASVHVPSWSEIDAEHDIETTDNVTTRVVIGHLRSGFVYLVRVAAVSVSGHVGLWSNKTFFMEDDSSSRRVSLLLSPQPPPPLIVEHQSPSSKLDVVIIHISAVEDFYLYPKLTYYDVLIAVSDGKSEDLNGTLCGKYSDVAERLMDCWVAARIPAALVEVSGEGLHFVIGDSNFYDGFFNGPLLAHQTYAIMLRTVDDKLESFSPFSVVAVRSAFGVEGPLSRDSRLSGHCYVWEIPCAWFFVMVVVLVILLWILIACCMFCRMKNQKKMKVHHEKKTGVSATDRNVSAAYRVSRFDGMAIELTPLNDTSARMETFKKSNFYGPIRIADLAEYVNLRLTHPTRTFEEEFKRIVRGQSFTWIEAKKPENIKKNRYGNILPYDQTRVRLASIPGISNSDYINASYVDGYDRPKFYIVTQGPKENTFHDFWRMIWQERTSIIVMLTGLVENKKKKCDQYWPNLSRLYGDILVHLISTDFMADVVVRHFELKIVATSDVRRVTHYHYAEWPDLSVPLSAMAVLSLRQAVRDELISNAGPIVVHCSGGAGRSGTFITIDAMLKQAFDEDLVHVHNYVNMIRTQRTNLVQTLDQYKFVYEALLEAVQSGNTKATCGAFSDYFRQVHQKLNDQSSNVMEEQLETLDNLNRRTSAFPSVEALTTENACKNRDPTVLPIEYSRVKLKPTFPDAPSPYINAVFVDGFHQKGELLVTQMPLDGTIEDFWTMVTQFKSTVVVMLNDCEFIDENTVPGQYWPNDGCTQYGDFLVEVVTFEEKGMLTVRKLRVTDAGAENSCCDPHFVIQLQFLDWTPDESVPSSTNSLVTAINTADVLRSKYGGPITVHCMDGASRSGLFAVSWLIKKQVIKGEVDVFQAVKRSRQHRPQFITSLKQYRFCYQVAMELVSSFGQNNFV